MSEGSTTAGRPSSERTVPTVRHTTWSRPIGRFLARVFWRTEVIGAEQVPAGGGAILVANHAGIIDGPIVFGVAPRAVHMFVKEVMFRNVLGLILRASGQISVDGSGGRAALAIGREVLGRGDLIGIFPEGRRGRGDVADARAGAAWLALHTGVPVIPVAVLGTRRTGERVGVIPPPGRRLVVEFGAPITVTREPGMSGKRALENANEKVLAGLRDVLRSAVTRSGIELPTDDPLGVRATGEHDVVE